MSILPLAIGFKDIFPYPWLQIPGIILVVALIIGWKIYRGKQM